MNVVFDLGNVLIQWDPRHLYRQLFAGDDAQMEWFLANVCTPSWNELHDAGQPFAVGVRVLSEAHPRHRSHIEAFSDRWVDMLRGEVPGTAGVLRDLKAAGVPVYALSNWSSETFPLATARFPFLAWFDGIVLSGAERLIKPDPRIYTVLLERYSLQPGQTVFIDDVLKNVEAARALGINGIHFVGADTLREQLRAFGLLTADAPPG